VGCVGLGEDEEKGEGYYKRKGKKEGIACLP
jgi:hypothetical protein